MNRLCLFAALVASMAHGEPATLLLPTDNTALLDGRPEEFYQFIDRDFGGVKSSPWEGGQYGFVRDPRVTSAGTVYRRFHEGIDIKPLNRGPGGIPLDAVKAIDAGRVVHASTAPGASNYGRYVVIEHLWDGCPYYSLYAHLASVAVMPAQKVDAGQRIGTLGYSGEGLDLRRAHVHLELNLLLSKDFDAWHARYFPNDPNLHGIFNGLNLTGINIAGYFLARQKEPALTVSQFLAREPVAFKVIVPAKPEPEILTRYPWLISGAKTGAAFEISFSGPGVPLSARAMERAVAAPVVSWVAPMKASISLSTRELVTGSAAQPRLTASGLRYLALITGIPAVPR